MGIGFYWQQFYALRALDRIFNHTGQQIVLAIVQMAMTPNSVLATIYGMARMEGLDCTGGLMKLISRRQSLVAPAADPALCPTDFARKTLLLKNSISTSIY